MVLTARQAEEAWKVKIGGSDHLLITAQDFFADPDAQQGQIWLRSRNDPHFDFAITPPLAAPLKATLPLTQTKGAVQASSFASEAPAWHMALELQPTKTAGTAPQVKLGPAPDEHKHGVAQAPAPGDLPQAAKWAITVPAKAMEGVSELYLQVNYQGDVARFSAAMKQTADRQLQ